MAKPGETNAKAIAQRIVGALGSSPVAALLGVDEKLLLRLINGQESLDVEALDQLADLDALLDHMLAVFTPAQARLWLEGNNAQLGARPIDVYRLEGSTPVIEAIDAHEQGVHA